MDSGAETVQPTVYTFHWGDNPVRARLKGRRCIVRARGRKGTVLAEFLDTRERVTCSFRALRRTDDQVAVDVIARLGVDDAHDLEVIARTAVDPLAGTPHVHERPERPQVVPVLVEETHPCHTPTLPPDERSTT